MKKLIITLFILTFFIPHAYAFYYEEGVGIFYVNGTLYDKGGKFLYAYTSNFTILNPSCQIIPIVDKKTIDSGDPFNITFLISCKGKIESNLICIYFPHEFLSNDKEAYFSSFLSEVDIENKTHAVWWNEKPVKNVIQNEGAIFKLVNVAFLEVRPDARFVFGETYTDLGNPPVIFRGFSNEKINPGDYKIKIIFQYSDGNDWYSSQEEVTIHVREFYEKPFGQIIIATIGGIILLIFNMYSIKSILNEIMLAKYILPLH